MKKLQSASTIFKKKQKHPKQKSKVFYFKNFNKLKVSVQKILKSNFTYCLTQADYTKAKKVKNTIFTYTKKTDSSMGCLYFFTCKIFKNISSLCLIQSIPSFNFQLKHFLKKPFSCILILLASKTYLLLIKLDFDSTFSNFIHFSSL